MFSKEISLPAIDNYIFFGKDSTWGEYPKPTVKLIIYYDSTICTTCKISEIWNWKNVINYAKASNYRFQPIFILSPPTKTVLNQIKVSLKKFPFEWPIFIDSNRDFYNQNTILPKESFFHTFLLDENNKIVLVGDPLLSNELWNLYEEKINSLLKDSIFSSTPNTISH